MTNEVITNLLFLLAGTLCGFITTYILLKNTKKNIPVQIKPLNTDYEHCIAILISIANTRIEDRKNQLRFNEKLTIPPLDQEMIEMTELILDSISPVLMTTLQQYMSKSFIISFVSKLVRNYCEDYIMEVRSK